MAVFDSEDIRRRIEVTEDVAFDATDMLPGQIPNNLVTIAPTIFKIGEFSIWVLSVTLLPMPLERVCYIELTVPSDLRFNNVEFRGGEFMRPN